MPIHPVMALDVGTLRIGVALTDPLGYTAQPLLTVWRRSRGEDLRNLVRLIQKHGVSRVIVGNPLHLSSDVSPWAKKVSEFANEVQRRSNVPCELWDERLTSVAAHEILNENGFGTKDRERVIDQVSAVLILESWMQVQEFKAVRASPSNTSSPDHPDLPLTRSPSLIP